MFYWMVKFLLRPVFTVLFRPVVTGREHIPRRGGAVLASNHLSMTDSLFLPVMTRRRVSFLAKAEYFTGRGLKGRAKAAFVRGTGLIPIDREDADSAAHSLGVGASSLRQGRLLGVYPEGTRSPDGRLYRGKTGAARMAIDAGVPVVPVAMVGTDRVQPIGKVLPRLARVAVHLGPPLAPPTPAVGEAARQAQARAFTEQIMTAIALLSHQERVDVDCASHKKRAKAVDRLSGGVTVDGLSSSAPETHVAPS
ncbi:MAG TPA: lysophospholipid acyltransferase family protein [Mycobacteriales bacterium]|nr:lysophospholipid acyltransferase family protein [Mycobacteriales bacterium]